MFAEISYPPIPIFEVGPLSLSLHGVFAAIGFLAGAWYASKVLERRGFDVAAYQSVLTWALVGSILGARWLTIPAEWVANGFDITELWNLGGNFSIMGGFAGGILVAAYRMRMVGLRVWPTLDVSTFGLAIGTIVGRIGDLAIVEHLGGPTTFFLGFGVKPGHDLAPQHDALECEAAAIGDLCAFPGDPTIAGIYHHSALYDMIGAALLFGVLYWIVHRSGWNLHYGQLFMGWVAWYGVQRFLIDFTRLSLDVGGDKTLGPFTWSQWSGLSAGVAGVALIWWFGRKQPLVSDEQDVAYGATPISA